jgi:hypothetical protein
LTPKVLRVSISDQVPLNKSRDDETWEAYPNVEIKIAVCDGPEEFAIS